LKKLQSLSLEKIFTKELVYFSSESYSNFLQTLPATIIGGKNELTGS